MQNLTDNILLLFSAVGFVWSAGMLFVAITAAKSGQGAHQQNKSLASGGLRASLRGELLDDDSSDEPRTNRGLAVDLRTQKIIPQGQLSAEAIDEVLATKV